MNTCSRNSEITGQTSPSSNFTFRQPFRFCNSDEYQNPDFAHREIAIHHRSKIICIFCNRLYSVFRKCQHNKEEARKTLNLHLIFKYISLFRENSIINLKSSRSLFVYITCVYENPGMICFKSTFISSSL